MTTSRKLQRKIEGAEGLQSVVKTMKALAVVNMRHFEKAVTALSRYRRTIERGLWTALNHPSRLAVAARPSAKSHIRAMVIGSDQGMCGSLNETISARVSEDLDPNASVIAVGMRAASRLGEHGFALERTYNAPGSVEGVHELVASLLLDIEAWERLQTENRILLFHNTPESHASYRPERFQILPLDENRLAQLGAGDWQGPSLPHITLPWNRLFSDLVRQYVYISLFRAVGESLASENAGRLAAMQGAESNIETRIDTLRREYRRQRQTSITAELLDIVSGFEALDQEQRG